MKDAPKGPYVYQPFGWFGHQFGDRIYGVSGVHVLAKIDGLTKEEAHAICDALKAIRKPSDSEPNPGTAQVNKE